MAISTATVTLEWSAVAGATRYVVELGTTPGSIDAIHQTATTSDNWPGLPVGKYYLRVKAANDVGSGPPSSDVSAVIIDRSLTNLIDGLLVGHGPFDPGNIADCPWEAGTNRWVGFPRGTNVRVRVSLNVYREAREGIAAVVRQAATATAGNISATFEETTESDPVPQAGEVTVTPMADPSSRGCLNPLSGCVAYTWRSPGVIDRSAIYVRSGYEVGGYAHEIGHALYGLCHVDGNRLGGPRNSLMSVGAGIFAGSNSPTLTAQDIAAIQAAYSTTLNPGADRDAFVRAGLSIP